MIHTGDCVTVMRGMEADSVDAVVTDPPYGLEFMGREWDKFRPTHGNWNDAKWSGKGLTDKSNTSGGIGATDGRPSLTYTMNLRCRTCGKWQRGSTPCLCNAPAYEPRPNYRNQAFQAWCQAWGREALRVTKPGGYLIAAGGTRTHHRLVCGLEDAGWEIRDELHHIFASGFPKSLNVSAALRKLPACTCDVAGKFGAVDTGLPAGSIGAGVGAEPGSVPLAGITADEASRVGPKASPRSGRRGRKVDADTVDLGWQLDPVVLGPLDVAGTAEGEQVVGSVGGVDADVEPLGDEVMDEQTNGSPAVGAPAIAAEDGVSDDTPASALVAPLPSSPSRVVDAGQPTSVVGGHAGAGAVDGLGGGSSDDLAAGSAGEGVTHPPDYTAEDRALRCEKCGGIRQDRIPEGMGTALKPAHEPWVLARKPLTGSVAANVERHGTGSLNIDAARIGGRWPSNLLLSDPELFDQANPWVVGSGATSESQVTNFKVKGRSGGILGKEGADRDYVSGFEDGGGYSRFFIIPKADRADREPVLRGQLEPQNDDVDGSFGLDAARPHTKPDYKYERKPRVNLHATVKPTDLMRHLIRLVTPPGGTVLDCFAGSGSTLIAAELEGFPWIGIEQSEEYVRIIEARLNGTQRGMGLTA